MSKQPPLFFIASNASEPGGGVYVTQLIDDVKAFTPPRQVAALGRVLFLRTIPQFHILLAAHDAPQDNDKPTGRLTAWHFDPQSGELTPLNTQPSGATTPCYIEISSNQRFALIAHFRGPGDKGSLSVIPIDPENGLSPFCHQFQYEGSSIHPTRQQCSHIHSALTIPNTADVYCADLGADRLHHLKIDDAGKLSPVQALPIEPGQGPRHMTLHPTGKFLYLITEIGNAVVTLSRDSTTGKLDIIDKKSTLPENHTDGSAAADLQCMASANIIIGSNRGHNSLACFKFDPQNGLLTKQNILPCGGSNPRGIGIGDNYCLVANQSDNRISIFQHDAQLGLMPLPEKDLKLIAPVCITKAQE